MDKMHNGFCFKVVTHPRSIPTQPGLTSEPAFSSRGSRIKSPKFAEELFKNPFSRRCRVL